MTQIACDCIQPDGKGETFLKQYGFVPTALPPLPAPEEKETVGGNRRTEDGEESEDEEEDSELLLVEGGLLAERRLTHWRLLASQLKLK